MEALGISLEGNTVKFAHIGKKKKSCEILGVSQIFLNGNGKEEQKNVDSIDEILGLGGEDGKFEQERPVVNLQSNLLFNALAKFPQKGLKVGINISSSDVSYLSVSNNYSQKDKKHLKSIVQQEISKTGINVEEDSLGIIPTGSKSKYYVFYHNNNFPLMDKILDIKSTTGSSMKLSLLDINETAMIHFFSKYAADGKTQAFIYVGNENSRIFVFKNGKVEAISQLINEGFQSDNLLYTLYGKLLLEQDNSEIEEFDDILISGEGELKKYTQFFQIKFSDSYIGTLPISDLYNCPKTDITGDISRFTVPIAIADKILSEKKKGSAFTNFLPKTIKKLQKPISIKWHGILIFIMTMISIGFFYQKYLTLRSDIKKTTQSISSLETRINNVLPVVAATDSLSRQIDWYYSRNELVSKLLPERKLYSDFIKDFSLNMKSVNSLWLEQFSTTQKSFFMSGKSVYRTRIHDFAERFFNSKIQNVESEEIRGKTIFKFNVTGAIPKISGGTNAKLD